MEAYLILIHIVLFSSDNTQLENQAEVEICQTYYMLFLHRCTSCTDNIALPINRISIIESSQFIIN